MTKLTFAEMQAKLDADAHNSNLSNLAHAMRQLTESRRLAEEAIEAFNVEADKLEDEINALAEMDQNTLTGDRIREPYAQSKTISLTYYSGTRKGY